VRQQRETASGSQDIVTKFRRDAGRDNQRPCNGLGRQLPAKPRQPGYGGRKCGSGTSLRSPRLLNCTVACDQKHPTAQHVAHQRLSSPMAVGLIGQLRRGRRPGKYGLVQGLRAESKPASQLSQPRREREGRIRAHSTYMHSYTRP